MHRESGVHVRSGVHWCSASLPGRQRGPCSIPGSSLARMTKSLQDGAKLCSAYFMLASPWGAGSYRQGAEQLPWRRPINNRSGWHHPHPYQAPHPGTTYGRVSVPPNCMHACVLQKPVHSPMILAGNGRPKSALDRRAPGCGRWCVIRSKG